MDVWRRDPTTKDVVRILVKNYTDLGILFRLRSDGGPQLKPKEYQELLSKGGVSSGFSTSHFLHSNSNAEAAVNAMKALVSKISPSGNIDEDRFREGLLEWRNTPRDHGLSPAEIVIGHPLRSAVPAHWSMFASKWRDEEWRRKMVKAPESVKQHDDLHARNLPALFIGDPVRIHDPSTRN